MCVPIQSLRWWGQGTSDGQGKNHEDEGAFCVNGFFKPQGTIHLQDSSEGGPGRERNPDLGSPGRPQNPHMAIHHFLANQGSLPSGRSLALLARGEKGFSLCLAEIG